MIKLASNDVRVINSSSFVIQDGMARITKLHKI